MEGMLTGSVAMFTRVSAGMTCCSQISACPSPIVERSTVGQFISPIAELCATLHQRRWNFLLTTSRGRQCRSFSISEVGTQPEEGELQQKLDSKELKKTVYDSLQIEKIMMVFPELNFSLDGNYYPKLVPMVVGKISIFLEQPGGEGKIIEFLQLLGLQLTPHIVGEVLKSQKDPSKAYRFFEWAGNQPGFEHNAHTYNVAFLKLVDIKNPNPGNLMLALILAEEMVAKSMKPDLTSCNALIDRFCKERRVGGALRVMQELEREDFPDVVTYNIVINGLCKSGLFKEGFELLGAMQERGLTPNIVTYNSIINGLGNAGRWQEACQIADELPEKGITPNEVTYNSLICCLFKCHEVDEALKFYGQMESKGCQPDLITYNTLIDGLAKNRRLDEACKIFSNMRENGSQLEVITWNSLIGGFMNDGNLVEALRLLAQMKEEGCEPSAVTYKLLGGPYQEDSISAAYQVVTSEEYSADSGDPSEK